MRIGWKRETHSPSFSSLFKSDRSLHSFQLKLFTYLFLSGNRTNYLWIANDSDIMDILRWANHYLSVLELKLIHICKRVPWRWNIISQSIDQSFDEWYDRAHGTLPMLTLLQQTWEHISIIYHFLAKRLREQLKLFTVNEKDPFPTKSIWWWCPWDIRSQLRYQPVFPAYSDVSKRMTDIEIWQNTCTPSMKHTKHTHNLLIGRHVSTIAFVWILNRTIRNWKIRPHPP